MLQQYPGKTGSLLNNQIDKYRALPYGKRLRGSPTHAAAGDKAREKPVSGQGTGDGLRST